MIAERITGRVTERTGTRVALLADTFHEVNGAARTCREWEAFARRNERPFLCVRWGSSPGPRQEGTVRILEITRSRLAFRIDTDLHFDPLFHRVLDPIRKELEQFRPDAIHITSPGDLGIAGAILAEKMKVPLVLSWHTNLHEFAARRIRPMAALLGDGASNFAARKSERFVLDRVCWFFGRGAAIFAPNPELADMLRGRTGKPVFPMGRGIDTALFNPQRRLRDDHALVLGYVGRLMPEKNLRVLAGVADALRFAGVENFRFQITGAGSERRWLQRNVPHTYFTGTLMGESLAQAYANLDVFLFPSRTDTFGNVVQEALASGVPAVVMEVGGPRFIVREGVSGFVAPDEGTFCHRATVLARDGVLRRKMAVAARRQVEGQTWDRTFNEVYDGYSKLLQPAR
jgi:glycosyltransferase involved in cell wall biosynthesis